MKNTLEDHGSENWRVKNLQVLGAINSPDTSVIKTKIASQQNDLTVITGQVAARARVFYTTPTGPYTIGDLWVNNGVIYQANADRDLGFDADEWDYVEFTTLGYDKIKTRYNEFSIPLVPDNPTNRRYGNLHVWGWDGSTGDTDSWSANTGSTLSVDADGLKIAFDGLSSTGPSAYRTIAGITGNDILYVHVKCSNIIQNVKYKIGAGSLVTCTCAKSLGLYEGVYEIKLSADSGDFYIYVNSGEAYSANAWIVNIYLGLYGTYSTMPQDTSGHLCPLTTLYGATPAIGSGDNMLWFNGYGLGYRDDYAVWGTSYSTGAYFFGAKFNMTTYIAGRTTVYFVYFSLGYYIGVDTATGRLHARLYDGSWYDLYGPEGTSVKDGVQHTALLSFSARSGTRTVTLWLDGVAVDSVTITGSTTSTCNIGIGGNGGGNDYSFLGSIGDAIFGLGTISNAEAIGYHLGLLPARQYGLIDVQLATMADDGIISTQEKTGLLNLWCAIYNDADATDTLTTTPTVEGEYKALYDSATDQGIWTPEGAGTAAKAFYDATEALRAYLFDSPMALNSRRWNIPITIDKATWHELWNTYRATADALWNSGLNLQNRVWNQASAPTIGSRPDAINGDIWLDSDDNSRRYTAISGSWIVDPEAPSPDGLALALTRIEAPEYPDSAAGTTYIQGLLTSNTWADWSANSNCTIAVVSGKLQVTATGANPRVLMSGSLFFQKTVRVKITKVSGAATNALVANNGGTILYYYQTYSDNELLANCYFPTGYIGTLSIWPGYAGSAAGDVYLIKFVYIGDGSYTSKQLDNSGNGNHFSIYGCTPVDVSDVGKMWEYDGINDRQVGTISGLTNKVSLCMIVDPDALDTSAEMLIELSTAAASNVGAFGVWINEGSAGVFRFYLKTGPNSTDRLYGYFILPDANKHVLVCELDLTQSTAALAMTVEMDGAKQTLTFITESALRPNLYNGAVYLGSRAGSSLWFDGKMSDVRMYSRIFDDAEHRGAAQGIFPDDCVYTLADYVQDSMASDSKITAEERVGVKTLWDQINGDGSTTGSYWTAKARAIALSLTGATEYTTMNTKRDALYAYLYTTPNALGSTDPEVTIVAATWTTRWADYYAAEAAMLNKIANQESITAPATYSPKYLDKHLDSAPNVNLAHPGCSYLRYSATEGTTPPNGYRGIFVCVTEGAWPAAAEETPTTAQIAACWADICTVINDGSYGTDVTHYTGAGVNYIQVLGACTAFIMELWAQTITIAATGSLQSSTYAVDGNGIPTAGFILDAANDLIKSFGSVFRNCAIDLAQINNANFSGMINSDALDTTLEIDDSFTASGTYSGKDVLDDLGLTTYGTYEASGTFNSKTVDNIEYWNNQSKSITSWDNLIITFTDTTTLTLDVNTHDQYTYSGTITILIAARAITGLNPGSFTWESNSYGPELIGTTYEHGVGYTIGYKGSVNIKLALEANYSDSDQDFVAYTLYGRIYVNSVAYGTERSLSVPARTHSGEPEVWSGGEASGDWTEEVAINDGDIIQIYMKVSAVRTYSIQYLAVTILTDRNGWTTYS